MVQLPLPDHIDKEAVLRSIPEHMDIDGLNPRSDLMPLTPCAIMRWLKEQHIRLPDKNVTILGRSELVIRLAEMEDKHGTNIVLE